MASVDTLVVAESSQAPPKRGFSAYRPELDVVRFLAFLLVFLEHLLPRGRAGEVATAALSPLMRRIEIAAANACGMGLCLFFALSAYLITDLLLRERAETGSVSIKRFYIRRILRIWPLYFLAMAIAVALEATSHKHDYAWLPWFLLFGANIYFCSGQPVPANPMMPLWSISVEEQFYLIWPWAMRWLNRQMLVAVALVFVLIANVTLFILGQRHANTDVAVWFNGLAQAEMFAVGMLLALLRKPREEQHSASGWLFILTAPVLWFLACFTFHAKQPADISLATGGPALMAGYALIALGCVAILYGFLRIGGAYMPRWAIGLGKVSYGLYVFHQLALRESQHFIKGHGAIQHVLGIAIALGLAIALAKISYAFFEKPFLKLKNKFEIIHGRAA